MPDINDQYYQKHLKLFAALSKRIRKMYESSVVSIAFTASTVPPKTAKFSLNLYPSIEKEIDKQLRKLHSDIYSAVISGIDDSWNLSNKKNDVIVDRRLASRNPSHRARQILYDPNSQALEAFKIRKTKGLDLSKRVWRTLKPFKKELEQGLGIGISEGRSAAKLAIELKSNLNDPNRLFRRVRGEDGKLRLSANARNYSPGKGVYRSSYANAKRLARTETNMAYRSADHERWQTLPFITGVEIRLSNNHPRYDICDSMAGRYPKGFKFVGWHPNCFCFVVPVMMNDEEYDKFEDKILGLGEFDERKVSRVVNLPTRASEWIKDNSERINGWKSKPYWAKDNARYMKGIL